MRNKLSRKNDYNFFARLFREKVQNLRKFLGFKYIIIYLHKYTVKFTYKQFDNHCWSQHHILRQNIVYSIFIYVSIIPPHAYFFFFLRENFGKILSHEGKFLNSIQLIRFVRIFLISHWYMMYIPLSFARKISVFWLAKKHCIIFVAQCK